MSRIFIFIAIFISSTFPMANTNVADQMRFPVEKFKLDNGMVVLLYEDHSAPLISFQQWYRVGSRNESPGRTGLAHFFEHLMFKGTKKYPHFDAILRKNGGANNAFTSHDYTGYYENMPSGTEELILDIESDRMRRLLFKQSEVDSEREVVKEERRLRYENSVSGSLREALYRSVFKVHPYKWAIIGSMKDLNAASIDDMKEFYKRYYAPNNSVLVVAGDISIPETKKLVEKYYGHIPSESLPDRKISAEPEQMGKRQITLKKNVQAVTFAYGYKSTPVGTDDAYALDLLSFILGSGESSRLYRALVRKSNLAVSVSSVSYTPRDPGMFYVVVAMRPKKNVKRAQKIVLRELSRFRHSLVSDVELEKAKNNVMRSYIDLLKSISGKAELLAWAEITFGDYQQIFQDIDRYQKVTKEEIFKVAKMYLKPSQSSLVQVVKK